MATTKIELDVQNAIISAAKYEQSITGMNVTTKDLIVTQAAYNKSGDTFITTTQRQIDAQRKLVTQVRETTKVINGLATQQIDISTKAVRGQVAPGLFTPTVKNQVARAATDAELRAKFPAPPSSTIAQLVSYENAISRIGNLVASGKISSQRVQDIFTSLKTGQALTDLSALEQRVASAVGTLSRQSNVKTPLTPTTANQTARIATEAQLKSAFPAPSNATIVQLARYENAIARIGELVSSGKVTGSRVTDLLGGLTSGKGLGNLSNIDRQVVSALSSVGKGFNNAEKAAQSFNLTVRNIFRITEAFFLKDAIGAIANKLKEAGAEAVKFQIKISEIRTISQGNQSSFNGWASAIRRVSDEFGLGNLDVAEAAYQAISNQVTSGTEQTESFLRSTANFARVGVASLTDATELTSSAINAYGFNVSKVDDIQGKFFKAVELGRFRVSDLANSFGRVAAPAAAIGVSFEEVLAGLTTLTRQGVSAADAQTQLLNLFNSLAKPSEKLSALLRTLGVDSAQAAIATFGLTGFLTKLEEATKGDVAAISELGGDLRAIRAIIGLTTRGQGDQFKSDLVEIQGSAASFKKAIDIRGESGGDELIKEFTKVKNFFVVDMGQQAVNALAGFNKEFVSLKDVSILFGKALVAGVSIFVAYRTYINVVTVSQAIYTAALVQTRLASLSTAAATTVMGRSAAAAGTLLGNIPWLKVITLAAAAAVAIKATFGSASEETEGFKKHLDELKDKNAEPKVSSESANKKFAEEALANQANIDATVDKSFKSKLQQLAQEQIKNNEVLESTKSKGKEVAEALKVSFSSVQDSIQKSIGAYENNITRARRGIEQLNRSIKSTAQTTEDIIFAISNQFASDDQKFQVRQNRIDSLIAQAERVAKVGGADAPQEIEALKKEAASLLQEQIVSGTQLSIDRVKASRKDRLDRGQITNAQANETIFVNPEASRGRILETLGKFDEVSGEVNKKLKEEINLNQTLEAQAKTRLKLNIDAAKILEKTTPTDEKGIRKEFATPTGGFNEDKFQKSRAKAEEDFLNTLQRPAKTGNLETDRELGNAFDSAIASLKTAFAEEKSVSSAQVAALVAKLNLDKKQKDVADVATEAKKNAGAATEALITNRTGLKTSVEKLGSDLRIYEKILEAANRDSTFAGAGDQTGNNAFQRNTVGTIQENAEAFTQVSINKITGLFNRQFGLNNGQGLNVSQRAQIAAKMKPEIDEAQAKINEIREIAARSVNAEGKLTLTAADVKSAIEAEKKLQGLLDRIANAFTGQLSADAVVPGGKEAGNTRSVKEARQDTIEQLKKLQEVVGVEERANASLQTVDNTIREQTGISRLQLNSLQIMAQSIPIGSQSIVDAIIAAATAASPLVVPGKAKGGMIRGPYGHDNILIAAQSDEMVMTREAVRKFYPQLSQMNSGVNPSFGGRFAGGGLVSSTNVGDVHVTINTPSSSKAAILELGKGLRREIRRGNLNLNKKD